MVRLLPPLLVEESEPETGIIGAENMISADHPVAGATEEGDEDDGPTLKVEGRARGESFSNKTGDKGGVGDGVEEDKVRSCELEYSCCFYFCRIQTLLLIFFSSSGYNFLFLIYVPPSPLPFLSLLFLIFSIYFYRNYISCISCIFCRLQMMQ